MKTILAVDNAIMFLNTLQRLLRDHPYELKCETSCQEALNYLSHNKPDLILLDVEMQDMDGYELCRKIRAGGQRAPILFITANNEKEYVDRAIEAGAQGLIIKPVRIKQLLEKIEELL